MKPKNLQTLAVSVAIASSLAAVSAAQANPFSLTALGSGYTAAGDTGADAKGSEGKCGEGKCGAQMKEGEKKQGDKEPGQA